MDISKHDRFWKKALQKREGENALRKLKVGEGLIDFSSNDYLGFASDLVLLNKIKESFEASAIINKTGSTGSRLISGNNRLFLETEEQLANVFQTESSLLFNSGYQANLAVFSTLPQKGDTVLYDELSHACIKDGIRLSLAGRYPFLHNDLNSLENKLKKATGNIFVGVESVYSMDGDTAPLAELSWLCNKYNALLIVDEAHSTGVFGKDGAGLCNELNLKENHIVRIHTFGKAMGCHGAAVTGSKLLKEYLINFARPFIFTTAMSLHSVISISEAFKYLSQKPELQTDLKEKISLFNSLFTNNSIKIPSLSPVHAFVVPGNEKIKKIAESIQNKGFDVRPILSPTVKKGAERLRVCLHHFNTEEEMRVLAELIKWFE